METKAIEGLEVSALPHHFTRSFPLFSKLDRFGRVAVVADPAWVRVSPASKARRCPTSAIAFTSPKSARKRSISRSARSWFRPDPAVANEAMRGCVAAPHPRPAPDDQTRSGDFAVLQHPLCGLPSPMPPLVPEQLSPPQPASGPRVGFDTSDNPPCRNFFGSAGVGFAQDHARTSPRAHTRSTANLANFRARPRHPGPEPGPAFTVTATEDTLLTPRRCRLGFRTFSANDEANAHNGDRSPWTGISDRRIGSFGSSSHLGLRLSFMSSG